MSKKETKDCRKVIEQKRQEMTNLLLEYINDNPKDWSAGWNHASEFPFNGKTHQKYKGANAILLWIIGELKGYGDPRWVTFNQATELGASVKKGEKAATVFYWRFYDKKSKKDFDEKTLQDMSADERLAYRKENVVPIIRTYAVFNAKQCENFRELAKMPELTKEERQLQNDLIEQVISNSEAPVLHDGGGQAYYSLKDDKIHLPKIEEFKSMQDYYATALHEIAHSTGHESRLNRHLQTEDKMEYAKEELRAELASVFMQDELGLQVEGQHFENHGAYLASWLQAIKEDANEFFKAAKDAEQISDYVAEHYAKQQKVVFAEEEKILGMDVNIKDWYMTNFPNDEFGLRLVGTFRDLQEAIANGADKNGAVMGIDDEIARQRIFSRLAELQKIENKVAEEKKLKEIVEKGLQTIKLKMTTAEYKIFQEFVDAYTNDVNLERKQIVDFGANRPKSSDFWYGLTLLGNVEQSGLSYCVDFDRTKEKARFNLIDNDNEVERKTVSSDKQEKIIQKALKGKIAGWEQIDVVKGGYAETTYEWFDPVSDVPLYEHLDTGTYYIGNLESEAKDKKVKRDNFVLDKETAQKDFEDVRAFIKKELNAKASSLDKLGINALKNAIANDLHNKYVGDSVIMRDAKTRLETKLEKEKHQQEQQSIVPAATSQTKYNTKEFKSMNNSVTLQGTLFEDAEMKTSTNGNKYVTVPLEVERNYGETPKTDIFPVTFFGDAAEQVCSFKKGDNISVLGYLKNSTYNDTTQMSFIGAKVEPAEIGSKNVVTLSGFVNNKNLELKEAANGTKYLSLALSIKDYTPEGKEAPATYSTFFATVFGKNAERMVANYHKRDLIQVTGNLNVNENGRLNVTAYRSELIRAAQEKSADKDDAHTADENTK